MKHTILIFMICLLSSVAHGEEIYEFLYKSYLDPGSPVYNPKEARIMEKDAVKRAKCLIDELPGVNNDPVAHSIIRECMEKHHSSLAIIKRGSEKGLFGYKNGAECTRKKASKTLSRVAAQSIFHACGLLYGD
jgi:hypothetical protein